MKVEVIQYTIKATNDSFYKLRYTINGFEPFIGDGQIHSLEEALGLGKRIAEGHEISEKVIKTYTHSKEQEQ